MPWLLAQTARREAAATLASQAAQAAADPPVQNAWPLLVGVCAVVAVVAVWLFAAWYLSPPKARRIGHPWRLFFQLARAHRLAWREVWLLYRLASRLKLQQPALVFVQPENFAPSRVEGWSADTVARLVRLRERLFAGLGQGDAFEAKTASSPQASSQTGVAAQDASHSPPASLAEC